MRQTITLAAAQTGPVLGEDMAPEKEAACALVREAATRGGNIICFPELLPTPFFPGRLRPDYERFFLELPCRLDPLLETARRHAIALIFPFGEKGAREMRALGDRTATRAVAPAVATFPCARGACGRHRGRVCFRRDPSSGRRVDRSVAEDGFAATACPKRAAVRRRRALASALTGRLPLRRLRP